MIGKSRLCSAIAALAFAHLPLAASAETRIIMEPSGSANALAFQNHTTATGFFQPGQTITVRRDSESFFWIYQHGLDLMPAAYWDDSEHVRAVEFARVSGLDSGVILPLVGNTTSRVGAIAVRVLSDRNTPVGEVSEVKVIWRLGIVAFKIRAACGPAGLEDASLLESATMSASYVEAGKQVSLKLKLAGEPACGGQPFQVTMPACLTIRMPDANDNQTQLNSNWEAEAGDTIELPVLAAPRDIARCDSRTLYIEAASGGVTKFAPILYVATAGPKVPEMLRPAGTRPKPKPARPGAIILTPTPTPVSP